MGINLSFGLGGFGGPRKLGIGDTVGLPQGPGGLGAPMGGMGALGGAPLTQALGARLGLGGFGAYQGAVAGDAAGSAPTPGAPGAPGVGGAASGGGIGGWLATHGDALKGIGGALEGAAGIYGALSQQQLERRRLKAEQDLMDRQRRDQEAGARVAGPGYAALLAALAGRLGTTPGAGG